MDFGALPRQPPLICGLRRLGLLRQVGSDVAAGEHPQ
jgi:hypothetical protein